MVGILLLPGIALQCVDSPAGYAGSLAGWLLGTLVGAGAGIGLALFPGRGPAGP
jgi:hypothetical protein